MGSCPTAHPVFLPRVRGNQFDEPEAIKCFRVSDEVGVALALLRCESETSSRRESQPVGESQGCIPHYSSSVD
jgi:hypothetical protein